MKVKLHIKLDGADKIDIKVSGIKKDNSYIYLENDIKVNICYSDSDISINRECNDYKIELKLKKNKKTTSTYSVFGGSKIFKLDTECKKLKVSDNKIEVEYKIDSEKFKYVLEVI